MILSWYMITEGMKNTVRYDIDFVNLYFFVFLYLLVLIYTICGHSCFALNLCI